MASDIIGFDYKFINDTAQDLVNPSDYERRLYIIYKERQAIEMALLRKEMNMCYFVATHGGY